MAVGPICSTTSSPGDHFEHIYEEPITLYRCPSAHHWTQPKVRKIVPSTSHKLQWQQLSHSCRAHPERLRVVWRVLDIHTHSYTPKYASAGADSTGISRHKQQHASFCKLRQCNTGRQCAAGDGGLTAAAGLGEARRGDYSGINGGNRPIKERVEDRRGRYQRCSSGAACIAAYSVHAHVAWHQTTSDSHNMP